MRGLFSGATGAFLHNTPFLLIKAIVELRLHPKSLAITCMMLLYLVPASALWNVFSAHADDWFLCNPFLANKACERLEIDDTYFLKGTTIVLLGDSLTRYQYLNLAYFIVNHKWASHHPPNESEREWSSWRVFYQGTNNRLKGSEICDCFRENIDEPIIENRVLKHNNITLVYLQWFGAKPMHGHDLQTMLSNATYCTPGDCTPRTITWTLDQDDVLKYLIPSLFKPTFVVLNQGFWPHPQWRYNHAAIRKTMTIAKDIVKEGGSVIWKSTTTPRNVKIDYDESDKVIDAVRSVGVHVFDAAAYTRDISLYNQSYWDGLHFNSFVYRELNKALLYTMKTLRPVN